MDKISHQKSNIAAINLIDGHYQSFAFKRHYHLDYHIGLITHGQQAFYSHGTRHYAGPGATILMPPDVMHDGTPIGSDGYQVKVFSIDPDWLADQAEAVSGHRDFGFNRHHLDDPALFGRLTSLHQCLSDPHTSQLAKDSMPLETFSLLLTRYGQTSPQPVYRLGRYSLQQLRDYVMAHLDEKISLADLASLCDLSPSQLLRQFKAATGFTPYAWLARLRLEHAMALLKAGYRSTDVAFHVGFYDQAHFTRTFKQTFGIAPSQVR
ncbi:AraC family transcriptional regulator [Photobacterium ganghwense]|uniref:AraC family transcriptional regulator n=1 Tax=Photobacterium ganghwense TaxID=320778 RepID=A0A0J1H2S2_9GAMM|nr:AraC family transcriptional regulator [Photobacterium ganghwense]KLV06088.1 AraC family transcriptional regulator [Photobacterium ganghwense]PSU04980.1 AraC family transcriptional regulator [Photobacterium ganghwense]QSV14016.1 AraC family transcriptional regulator [Photobacterium ganghwense]